MKGIKRDAHRQYHAQYPGICFESHKQQCIRKRRCKEIVIFKKSQEPDIHPDTQPEPKFLPRDRPAFIHLNPCKIIQEGGEYQQKQKTVIPAGIEEVTGHQQQYVLQFKAPVSNKPIKKKYYW